ncbi:MAG: alpha-L-rhamnosidase-related protein [Paludibacter sp.]
MKNRLKCKTTLLRITFLVIAVAIAFRLKAQIPPVFDKQKNSMHVDELTRVYITPQRIVWMNNPDSSLINDEKFLLIPGNEQAEMGKKNMCEFSSTKTDTASFILDYGKEIQGGLKLVLGSSNRREPSLVRIRFGESVGECCSTTNNSEWKVGFSTDDHAKRDIVIEIPRDGSIELGNTGFRFVRLDLLQPATTIHIKEISAILRYRNIPYLGSFKCNDERLNDIWMTGAYTVHLNMQEFLWDGIKRDRLVWIGDMHPEVSTISSVFGYNDVVPKSLNLACEQFPLPGWMNNISAYSMWYLIIQYEWYMQNGDLTFLKKHGDYIKGLVDLISKGIDKNGNMNLSKRRFLDWPSSPNALGIESGNRALAVWGLQDAQKLCHFLDDSTHATVCKNTIVRLHLKTAEPNNLKQAAALMAIAGLKDPKQACDQVVTVGGAKNFSTFYGLYMLDAMALAGEYKQSLNIIRQYWGGMLDMGATTFWEDFNLDWMAGSTRLDEMPQPGKKDIHGDFGAYCYPGFRHSFCHGWSSGPTSWLSRYVLGVQVFEPGCKVVRIEPHLGDLLWVEGTYPTPLGVISIRHEMINGKIVSKIEAPKGIKIVR